MLSDIIFVMMIMTVSLSLVGDGKSLADYVRKEMKSDEYCKVAIVVGGCRFIALHYLIFIITSYPKGLTKLFRIHVLLGLF